MATVLVIDDEYTILDNLKFVLEMQDYVVLTAPSGEEGIETLKNNLDTIEVVITDMRMPKMTGLEVMEQVKKLCPELCVIILTGHGDMENAIEAMKKGAFEYLKKPIDSESITISINNAITQRRLTLEKDKAQMELAIRNEYMEGLKASAEKILSNMLPINIPYIPNYKFSIKYKSADFVGGDMYDVCDIGGYVLFYVFDVSSHGILASVITVILKSFIKNMEYNYKHNISNITFTQFIDDLNANLYANTARNVFATLAIGFIEKSTNKLHYISAGHIDQYILSEGNIKTLSSTGTILGVFDDAQYQLLEIQLKPLDRLLLFTDGINEASPSPADNLFGMNRIMEILKSSSNSSIEETTEKLYQSVLEYSKGEVNDDITILGIDILTK